MNDLDTQALRQALKAPSHPGDPVDVSRIMARGRRLRHRRRLAAVAGCLCAAAVLAGTATAIANLTSAPSAPLQPAGPGRHAPAGGQPLASHVPLPAQRQATARGVLVRPTPTPRMPTPAATRVNQVGVPSAGPTATGTPPAPTARPTSAASATPEPTGPPAATPLSARTLATASPARS